MLDDVEAEHLVFDVDTEQAHFVQCQEEDRRRDEVVEDEAYGTHEVPEQHFLRLTGASQQKTVLAQNGVGQQPEQS